MLSTKSVTRFNRTHTLAHANSRTSDSSNSSKSQIFIHSFLFPPPVLLLLLLFHHPQLLLLLLLLLLCRSFTVAQNVHQLKSSANKFVVVVVDV